MRFAILFVFLCTLATCATAQPQSTAAEHYMAGLQAWQGGDTDIAILEWREALRLKPSSSVTKDRLIEALTRKVELLQSRLASCQSQPPSSTQAGSMTGNPGEQVHQLPPKPLTEEDIMKQAAVSVLPDVQQRNYPAARVYSPTVRLSTQSPTQAMARVTFLAQYVNQDDLKRYPKASQHEIEVKLQKFDSDWEAQSWRLVSEF